MSLRVSTLALVVLGAGCATSDLAEPQVAAVQQDVVQLCDGWLCGTNSPQIASFGFWELNFPTVLGTPGLPNNVGMQVLGFAQGGSLYLPKVFAGKLTATRDATTLSGSALVGGSLYLGTDTRLFRIGITEVGSVESWAQPTTKAPHVMLESYKLNWSEFVNNGWGDPRDLCPHPPDRESGDGLTMIGQFAFHTLLFEGDRIDPIGKRDTGVDTTWVNLGCAGSALAKMALTGHTEAARVARTFVTKLAERQTMLKLLAADYCGDGTPFTVPGQPLNWRDDRGTMKLAALIAQPPKPLVLESRWTPDGAACLDKPRIDAHWTQLGNTTFGADVYDQVQQHCTTPLPPCDPSFEVEGYHLLSATPL
jgi:ADYC domain